MFEGVGVEDLLSTVGAHDFLADPALDFSAARVDAIVAYERVIRAAQARQLAHIAAMYTERMKVMSTGSSDPALTVIGELGMARNVSPGAAGNQFGIAVGLAELPQTAAALEAGQISERTARAIVGETDALHRDDRIVLDAEIAGALPGLTPGRAARLARHHVIAIDADAAHARAERNRADQRVTVQAEVDGVAFLQVRGPADQVLAAHRSLTMWARGLRATGDERSMGQIMCATLVERVTGLAHADQIDVEIGITISADTLLGADDTPAELDGYGPLTPGLVDDLIARAHRVFYRRLITGPIDDTLIGRDPRRRRFDGALAGFIRARDRHRPPQAGGAPSRQTTRLRLLHRRHRPHHRLPRPRTHHQPQRPRTLPPQPHPQTPTRLDRHHPRPRHHLAHPHRPHLHLTHPHRPHPTTTVIEPVGPWSRQPTPPELP